MCYFSAALRKLFVRSDGLDSLDFDAYLDSLPPLSTREVVRSEKPISADEVADVLGGCAMDKSPGLDGLPYELYCYIPDLSCTISAAVCCN